VPLTAGSPSNTISPWPRPTSVPTGILIHTAVWPQQTWAKNCGLCPLWGVLGPHLTLRGLGEPFAECGLTLAYKDDDITGSFTHVLLH